MDSDTGSTSYITSRYTLQTQTARLRDYFQHTPPERLQIPASLSRVDEWHDNVLKALGAQKSLGEDQKARMAALRDQVKLAAIAALSGEGDPASAVVNFDWIYVHDEILKIAPEPESERFTSLPYLRGSAGPLRGVFRSLVPDMDGLERLTVSSAQARIEERFGEILRHYRSAGTPFSSEQQAKLAAARDAVKDSTAATLNDPSFRARLADYTAMRARVAAEARKVRTPFDRERLDADRKKLDTIADELLAFVNEPLSELAAQTQAIATPAQFSAGPFRRPNEPSAWVDFSMRWALTLIGACLMLGLLTPLAALAAAGQLAMFYFASPPWPGLPAASLGGHYLYVDRNLIEMIAALLVAATASGKWAGLDAYLEKFWAGRLKRAAAPAIREEEPAPVAAGR